MYFILCVKRDHVQSILKYWIKMKKIWYNIKTVERWISQGSYHGCSGGFNHIIWSSSAEGVYPVVMDDGGCSNYNFLNS